MFDNEITYCFMHLLLYKNAMMIINEEKIKILSSKWIHKQRRYGRQS